VRSARLGFTLFLATALSPVLRVSPALAARIFQVPPACGSLADFESGLARLLGSAAAATPAAVWISEADARRQHTLRIQIRGETRQLQDANCRTLLESAVVITAAAARALELERSPPKPTRTRARSWRGRRALVPSRPARRSSEAPLEGRSPESAASLDRGGWALAIGGGIAGGVLPGVAPLFELRVSGEPAPLGWGLAVHYLPEQSAFRAGRGVDVDAIGGRATGTLELAYRLHLTAGLELNRLAGTARADVSNANSDAAWQLAPILGLSVIPWSIENMQVELAAVGRLSLVRPRFVVNGFGDLYQTPLFGADAIIRMAWLFR
jgi:hypothetical protein